MASAQKLAPMSNIDDLSDFDEEVKVGSGLQSDRNSMTDIKSRRCGSMEKSQRMQALNTSMTSFGGSTAWMTNAKTDHELIQVKREHHRQRKKIMLEL